MKPNSVRVLFLFTLLLISLGILHSQLAAAKAENVQTANGDFTVSAVNQLPQEAPPINPHGLKLLLSLIAVFFAGIALNLTSCVYPLIPITISYFGARSTKRSGKPVIHCILYLMGLSTTNSLLGVTAAMTGGLMGAILQNSWVLAGVSLVLVIFSLSLFDVWELKLPNNMTQWAAKSYTGYFGSFFMGLTLGIIAAPCIGPFILGLLTWVANVGQVWFGFIVFFSLSLGLGLPLVLLALFSGKLQQIPRSGEWMLWVRKALGWILLGMAAYFIRPLLTEVSSKFIYSFIALSAGFHLAIVDKSTASFKHFKWIKKGAGLFGLFLALTLINSGLMRGEEIQWQSYSDQLIKQASQKEQPVLIDFYASWCAPCRDFEETTFRDPLVLEETKKFLMVKVDITTNTNLLHRQLVEKYNVQGVPTLIILDKNGQERHDLRILGYKTPQEFLKHIEKAF